MANRTRTMTPAEVLALGADRRQHAAAVRPDWPSESERAADQASHLVVSDALRAVTRFSSR